MMSLLMIVCLCCSSRILSSCTSIHLSNTCWRTIAAQRDARPPAQHHAHQPGKGFPLCARPVLPGWYFLGALAAWVGASVRQPVLRSDQAELYIFLRERAIQNGLLDPRELNLYPVPPVPPYGVPQQDTAYATYQKPAQGGQGTSYGAPSPMYPGAPVPPHAPTQGYPPYGTMRAATPTLAGANAVRSTPPQNPSAPYPPYGAAPAQNPDASGPHAPYGVNAPGYPGAAPQAPAPWEHPSEPAAAHPADSGTRDIFQAPPHDVASAGAQSGPRPPI